MSYNVQTTVDTRYKLIVAHDATNAPVDRNQLFPMAGLAQHTLKQKEIQVLADRGYYKGEAIKACYGADIKVLVPKTLTSGYRAAGMFDKQDFNYDSQTDQYTCPAGETLSRRFESVENGMVLRTYYTSQLICQYCALKAQCTRGKVRRVKRWEHEYVLDAMEDELRKTPDAMSM